MLEPEMAFAELEDLLDTSEKMLRDCVQHVLTCCEDDLHFFETRSKEEENSSSSLRSQLDSIVSNEFVRMTYTEAVKALESSSQSFEYPIQWGAALQTEHERWLCETYCEGRPVFVTNYPKSCKPFYMRSDDGDRMTVGAFDLLLPGIGELIGGSEREERPDLLSQRMKEMNLLPQLDWYVVFEREAREFQSYHASCFNNVTQSTEIALISLTYITRRSLEYQRLNAPSNVTKTYLAPSRSNTGTWIFVSTEPYVVFEHKNLDYIPQNYHSLYEYSSHITHQLNCLLECYTGTSRWFWIRFRTSFDVYFRRT